MNTNNERTYTFWLPDEKNDEKSYEIDTNSIIIVGANGSGKSKLGAWIEKQHPKDVHRIGAQRKLYFENNIPLKSYLEAENTVLYGHPNVDNPDDKNMRWDYGKYTTKLIDDVESVLAALIAKTNNDYEKFTKAYKRAIQNNTTLPKEPITTFEKLQNIWNKIFPQRQIELNDGHFYALLKGNDNNSIQYLANEMSDGERSVLYLAAQVICVPENKLLIIDEPEIHLHASIMNRLWMELEKLREDCLFIYITHDTNFAASHSNSYKLWVKEFDGNNWILNKLDDNDLPEDLYMQILGSRKNAIFIEGSKSSYDYQLYSKLYSNYIVIPCGGCEQVISYTKAFKNIAQLHNYEVYGIIDRDYRSDTQIEAYKKHNVFPLKVAEVENLFLVEELIRLIAKYEHEDENSVFNKVKDYIINTKFNNLIQQQICSCLISEIKYRLFTIDIDSNNPNLVKDKLNATDLNAIYEETYSMVKRKFENAKNNYSNILKVFNEKGLSKEIGNKLGYCDSVYCDKIIKFLDSTDLKEQIIIALKPYLPEEIPIG